MRAPSAALWAGVGAVLVYGAALALASPAGFPDHLGDGGAFPYLSDKPVGEDGFYMLRVAQHLADGRGLSYDGLTPTTGVQPLSTVAFAGLAWINGAAGGDAWTFVRLVILLGVLTHVALALVVGGVARAAFPEAADADAAFAIGAALALFNFAVFRASTYGLETGLYLVLVGACVAYALRTPPPLGARQAVTLGLLAGLAGLARIDFGVVLAVVLAASVVTRRLRVRAAFTVGAVALAVVAPWLAWVRATSGSWLPSSGGAQSALITAGRARLQIQEMAEAVVNHLTPWVFTGSRTDLTALALGTLLGAGLWLWRRRPRPAPEVDPAWARTVGLWGGSLAVLVPVYTVFFWATHFYERYTMPLLVVALPAMAVALVRHGPRPPARTAAAAVGAMALAFAVWAGASLHIGRIGNPHAVTAGFVQDRYGPPHRVGAFQSGVVGYFNPNVWNLDGKLDAAALAARRTGTQYAYVDSVGLDVMVDWPHKFRVFPRDYLRAHWTPCDGHPGNGRTLCVRRIAGPDPASGDGARPRPEAD